MLGSLLKMGIQWAEKQKPIVVHQGKCTHSRHKASTCDACLSVCPAHAIDLKNGIEIDWDCIGCGLCTSVCPTEALQLKEENLNSFYTKVKKAALAKDKDMLFFQCHSMKKNIDLDPITNEITLECLGQIDDLSIQLAIAHGVKSFYFLSEACGTCKLKSGIDLFQLRLDQWKEKWPGISWVQLNKEEYVNGIQRVDNQLSVSKENQHLSGNLIDRRQFFKYLGTETKHVVVETVAEKIAKKREETPWKDGQLSSQSSIRIQVYQQWIKPSLETPIPVMDKTFRVNDRCTYCEICEKVCPTQAIEVKADRQEILFNQEQCVDCHLCEDVCYRNAISMN